MAIAATDIKLLKSERMSDAADGGGRMTSTEVPDGVAGSIFPKVSRSDSTYGRVNLRKVYAAVRSALTETYGGAHTIITDPPDNNRIGVVLFTTGSHFDDRTAARDRIESYVVAGPLSRARIYGNQTVGQRALLLYQRTEEPLPDVGQVLCLSVEAAGYTPAQQFVKIEDVAHEVRNFTDATGDFQRRVLSLKLSNALVQTFVGSEPSRYVADPSPTKVRDTQVADTSRYYGIRKLAAAADVGDIAVKLESIYAPLVPSTQRETAVSMVQLGDSAAMVRSGDPITFTWSAYLQAGQTFTRYLPGGVLPGSFSTVAGIHDDGAGNIAGNYGTTGTIDYATGAVTMTFSPQGGFNYSSPSVTYTPAVQVAIQSHTDSQAVTLATRGIVYTQTLNPLPAAGSVIVDFRSMGKWYRLRDNGTGGLVGNSQAEGSGTVSYSSGAVLVTLGALPDIDSEVIFTWASGIHFAQRAGTTVDNPARGWQFRFKLAHLPVKPGSVSIVWKSYAGDTAPTIWTDAGGTGVLSGSYGSGGTVDYATGDVVMRFGESSGSAGVSIGTDTTASVSYQQELPSGETPLVTTDTIAVTTPASFNCGRTNITPKTFRLTVPLSVQYSWWNAPTAVSVTLVDNGSGGLVTLAGQAGTNWGTQFWWLAGESAGTINYSTGAVTLTTISMRSRQYAGAYVWTFDTTPFAPIVGDYLVSSKAAASTYAAQAESFPVATVGLSYDLTTSTIEKVVPGSVMLDFSVDRYIDRSGKLYRQINGATGAGLEAGTIDYDTGVAKITAAEYGNMGRSSGTPVASCLTAHGEFTVAGVSFRTAGSPVRAASLYVQATALDGSLCSGTADANGNIVGTHIRGHVRITTGVAVVEFGDTVDGVWTPRQVFPSTLRYSCVVVSSLPLDPTLLGLDPVRLPSDGRVPVVRPADIAVIHETTTTTLSNPAVAGATYSSGKSPRVDGAVTIPATTMLELRDAAGQRVADALYTRDLVAGNVTMADPLDLTGYTQPLKLRARVEDMVLVTDTQITGDVGLSAPLLYSYSTNAYLSSALPAGDINARVERIFDQASWANVWSDTLAGSGSTDAAAQFNDLQYPILVTNRGAIKERWRAQITAISPLTVSIYGESLGLVGSFNATGTIAPVNPLTGDAYFSIAPGAWGAGGWSVSNNVRFNTVAANYPIWIARTILGGAALTGDSFDVATRGDID